ncbi:very short patch repair endonuclease [Rhizobium rhizogenes]|uniref:very short patch repair endonuclease n=1 Tax=Rhizobium rhizogenes TaxID=359 RepID=UPI0015743A3A|nr:very short patch repair endonuclease [Rhizobium rhizogenes]MDJ1638562.1 very short patch repair endonuclease [Rhizobium rhizogenes]NTG75040.1 very short patch repair endonuclease [Rhizobium rhizogenes]
MTHPKPVDAVAPATSKRMAATAGRNNQRERALRSELHRRGLRFRLHQRLLTNSRRTVDIVFSRSRVAVLLDGCFWHGCPTHGTWPKNNAAWWREKIEANIARDRDTDRRLTDAGWHVLRIWEHEPIEVAADLIEVLVLLCSNAKSLPALHQPTGKPDSN